MAPSTGSSTPPSSSSSPSPLATQLRNLSAGGFGGILAVLVGHPFDLVKVRLQTSPRGTYSSALDVVRRTVAREGFRRGMYAGVSAPLVGVTPMFMVSFWGYGVGKELVEKWGIGGPVTLVRAPTATGDSSADAPVVKKYSTTQVATAGFLSAIPMTLVTAPFERVKIVLQIQGQHTLPAGQKPKYAGGWDVVRQLYASGGVRSVFRGAGMTLARDGPGSAAYFAAYELVKRRLTPRDDQGRETGGLSLSAVIVAGGAAGVAMWIPVFPIDTVKSRLQSGEGKGEGVGKVIKGLWRGGGVRAFFPGFGPALARAVPANAATFVGVEGAQWAFREFFGN